MVGLVAPVALSLPKTRYAQFGRRKWRELGTDRTQMRCLLTDVGLSSGAGCLAKACANKVRPQSDNECFDGRLQFSFGGSFTRRDDRTGDVAHPPLATQSPSPRQRLNRARQRSVLLQCQMRSRSLVIVEVGPQYPSKSLLAQNDDMVEAVPPN